MSTTIVTLTAPMLADVDFARFRAEAEALGAEIYAAWHPVNGLTRKEAAMCAAAEVERRYAAELARAAAAAAAEAAQAEAEAVARAAAKRAVRVARAEAKAAYHLAAGVKVRRSAGGAWLVPSAQGNAVIYVVASDFTSCTCKAGETGAPCWHVAAAQQTAEAQPEPTPPAAPLAFDARRVLATVTIARGRALAA